MKIKDVVLLAGKLALFLFVAYQMYKVEDARNTQNRLDAVAASSAAQSQREATATFPSHEESKYKSVYEEVDRLLTMGNADTSSTTETYVQTTTGS